MDTAALSLFFAVLSLACWIATVTVLVLVAIHRYRPTSATSTGFEAVRASGLWLAWLIAAVATAGSLYYSQIAHYQPCELCWLQRICIYPLAAILLIAAIRHDAGIWRYVLPQVVVGAVIAAYHTQLQAFPAQATFCSALNPCTARYVWELGFVSLPFMALSAFCFVLVMVLVAASQPAPVDHAATSTPIGVS